MTIKQLGGVFGRNPTFNDVTIEGQLTFDGDIDINSDLKVSGELEVVGNINSTGRMRAAGGSDQGTQLNMWTTAGGDGSLAAYQLVFNTGPNDARVEGARFTPSGNLAFVSGKGIDFSATAGTGTSELLDDYEEGDWTPIYKTSGTNYDSIVYNFQFGTYIKIGQLVWVSFQLRTTSVTVGSASGNIRLGGLPFTVGSGNADDAFSPNAIHTNFASGAHGVSSPVNGTIESQLMDSSHSIASAATIATGANGNWLQGNIIYVAS